MNDDRLPTGEYNFLEYFCNKRGCDCRRSHIAVTSPQANNEVLATISFGWESLEFYADWMSCSLSDPMVSDMKGPALLPMNKQSEYSEVLFDKFISVVLDDTYTERVKRHYRLFKDSLQRDSSTRGHRNRKDKRKAKRAIRKKNRKKR
ncbi:MAG: hypothetical protein CMH57_09845 [Myxococcales bacterium]|nr:hypothetical protein [Myxococcales bacterium]